MRKPTGFTLIELVVVIVILGILAVTAAPKFLNLQGDAREASLQGLKGAMDGAAVIVYGKSAIEGLETASAATTSDGITVVYGYPDIQSTGILDAVVGLDSDWETYASGSTSLVAIFDNSNVSDLAGAVATSCYLTYTQAPSASGAYSASVTPSGC